MDPLALQQLGRQPIDWRAKGWPAVAAGTTVEQFVADRPSLFAAGFLPPVMVLRDSAVDANVATMADFAKTRDVLIAPHGKTHMAPQLAARQLAAGAWGVTVATISQARVYRAFGARRLLLANELVDPAAVAWVMAELAADPELEFFCYVDSAAGVDLLATALADAPGSRRLDVLVEVGPTGARTGCRTVPQAVAVVKAAAAVPRLRVCGVAGYEGGIGGGGRPPDAQTLGTVRDFMGLIRDTGQAIVRADLLDRDDLVASAGGSAFFDIVADELRSGWTVDRPVTAVLRSGSYLTHDSLLYARLSPFTERIDGELTAALAVWATVLSVPEPGLALVGAGRRDVPFDSGLPLPQVVRRADGTTTPATGLTVTALNDQHAYLRLSDQADSLQVGDWVRFGISHPCTAFDKWSHIALVDDDDRVIDCIRTFF